MYVKLVIENMNGPTSIKEEILYECSGIQWLLDENPSILRIRQHMGQVFDILMSGMEGESLTVYTMNNQGKTIDSRAFEF